MVLATCELIWLKHLLQELRFGKDEQMKLVCDNQAALHIASNPIFHEWTKHIEVDYHFIKEKNALERLTTSCVNSSDQLADTFTKSLKGPTIKYMWTRIFQRASPLDWRDSFFCVIGKPFKKKRFGVAT